MEQIVMAELNWQGANKWYFALLIHSTKIRNNVLPKPLRYVDFVLSNTILQFLHLFHKFLHFHIQYFAVLNYIFPSFIIQHVYNGNDDKCKIQLPRL